MAFAVETAKRGWHTRPLHNGSASAFQADGVGSIPIGRSPRSSSGLGRRPLTAVTPVQIWYGVLIDKN